MTAQSQPESLWDVLNTFNEKDKIQVDDCVFTFLHFGAPLQYMGEDIWMVQVKELNHSLIVGPQSFVSHLGGAR